MKSIIEVNGKAIMINILDHIGLISSFKIDEEYNEKYKQLAEELRTIGLKKNIKVETKLNK